MVPPSASGQGDTLGISQVHCGLWQRGHFPIPGYPMGPCWDGGNNFVWFICFLKELSGNHSLS